MPPLRASSPSCRIQGSSPCPVYSRIMISILLPLRRRRPRSDCTTLAASSSSVSASKSMMCCFTASAPRIILSGGIGVEVVSALSRLIDSVLTLVLSASLACLPLAHQRASGLLTYTASALQHDEFLASKVFRIAVLEGYRGRRSLDDHQSLQRPWWIQS